MKRFLVMTCAASLLLAGRVALSAEQGKPRARVQMCLAAAADFEPIYPTSTFPATSKGVTAVFQIADDETFKTLTGVFTVVDVGDAAPANTEMARVDMAVKPGKRGRFIYTQDNALPPGDYRLDILADGKPWQSAPFQVEARRIEPHAIDPPAALLPLEEGQVWAYAFTQIARPGVTIRLPGIEPDEDGTLRAKVTRTVRETDDTGTRVELHRNGDMVFEEWFRLDEHGLTSMQRRTADEVTTLDPPQVLWPLPLTPKSWTYTPSDQSYQLSCQMWGPLPVAAPDGEIPGYIVLVEQPTPIGKITVERHFVPGVGMAREVITTAMAGQMVTRQEMILQQATARQPVGHADDYFPAAVGHTWIYEAEFNGEPARMTRTITGTEEIGDRSFYVMQQEGVPGVEAIHVHVSPEGVHLLDAATRDNNPQMELWVKLPLKVGDRWTEEAVTRVTTPVEGANAPGDPPAVPPVTFTVEEQEPVEVPAGTFQAVPIRTVSKLAEDTELEMASWFAPGVGEVKRTIRVTEGQEVTFELKLALREFRAAGEAEAAADAPGEAYYPLAAGHTWVYAAQVDGEASELTKRVTGVEEVGGREAYVVSHEGLPGMMKTLHLHQTPQGAQLVKARFELREPIPWVQYPLRPGETWTGRLFTADGQDGGALSFTVEPTEEVTVPAGTFEAVRLRMDGETHGPSLQSRVWLAPGVGEVKRTVRLSQGDQTISESTLMLKQFKPADE
jgi:hypothetical protein